MVVEAVLAIEPDAGEFGIHDEVDDAGDGVSAVGRRSAARQNFGPLHDRRRDHVKVGGLGGAVGVTRRETAAVDQNQGTLRTQIAKIDFRGTGGAVGNAGCLRSADRRKAVQKVFNAGVAGQFEILARNHRDRGDRLKVRLRNAGAGNDDVASAFIGGRGGVGRLRFHRRWRLCFNRAGGVGSGGVLRERRSGEHARADHQGRGKQPLTKIELHKSLPLVGHAIAQPYVYSSETLPNCRVE